MSTTVDSYQNGTESKNGSPAYRCDPLAYAAESPDLNALLDEYQRAWSQGLRVGSGSNVARYAQAEDVRFTRWPGQSVDGLKHQKLMPEGMEARPYDKAPDCRYPLADETVSALVDILIASFWGTRINPRPVHATRLTMQQCAELRAVINWMRYGPLQAHLDDVVELLGQVAQTGGHAFLYAYWIKRSEMRTQTISMEDIMQMAQQAAPGSVMSEVPGMLEDESRTDEAVAVLQQVIPDLADDVAKQVIDDLRNSEDHTAQFAVPVPGKNEPGLRVLVPGMDIVRPVEGTDVQKDRCIFIRDFYSEADLESMVRDDGWDEAFVEAAKQTAGLVSDQSMTDETVHDENLRMIEIVTAVVRQVNEDGVPGIYCTIFSPHLKAGQKPLTSDKPDQAKQGYAEMQAMLTGKEPANKPKVKRDPIYTGTEDPLYARHFLLDFAHDEYPVTCYQTEVTGKRPSDARGVPEQLNTAQREVKRQRDGLFVFTELSITPPLKRMGNKARSLPPEFGPLAIINSSGGDGWEWFSPPMGRPELAFKLIEDIRRERDEQHGLARADVHPQRTQTRQQKLVRRWLGCWAHAFWQLAVLAYQNLSTEELTDLLGRPPQLTMRDLLGQRIQLYFDVRSLDGEWVQGMVEQIAQVLQTDTAGTVDHAKLTGMLLGYLDTTLAEEVTLDQAGAAQAVFNSVQNQVALIMLGNEANYQANDPAAKMKLQFLNQILSSNPDYIAQLDERSPSFAPRKRQLLEKYAKSLQQSVNQQENKLIGRIGVKPMAMENNRIGN